MRSRPRCGTAALGCAVLALGVLACAPSQAPTAPAGELVGQPKAGGSLRHRITSDIDNFDITTADKAVAGRIVPVTTERLLGLKSGPDIGYVDVQIRPELAERWEVSPDAKTFTFHLRKGARFAPSTGSGNVKGLENGREMIAADVKFSIEYLTRTGDLKDKKLPKAQFDWMFEGLTAIDTPDAYTVVVRFKDAFAPFLNYAASSNNPILPHEIFDQDGHYKDRLIGTGPFQYDKAASQSGTRWVFKKNQTYWQPGKPYFDEGGELVIKENATALAAFQTKQLDVIDSIRTASTADDIVKANPGAVRFEGLNPSPTNIYINSRVAPMNDVRVRKAFGLALDRDQFIKAFGAGKGAWALAGALPDTFTQEEARRILHYDPAEAKRLLSEAGYSNGLDLEWLHFADDTDETVSELQLAQAQLKQVGINLTLRPRDRQEAIDRRRQGQFTISSAGKALESDAESYLFQVFYPGAGNNYGGVNDPKLTELIVAQRKESDPDKRKQLIRQAVEYINAEAVWGVAIYNRVEYQFWHPYLKGYYPNRWGAATAFGLYPIQDLWFDK